MADQETQTIQTVRKVSPAVVSIVISKLMPDVKKIPVSPSFNPGGDFGLQLPEQFLEQFNKKIPEGQKHKVKVGGGSGFIISSDGMILTNKHVVLDTEAEYTVVASDGHEYKGRVLTLDPINDVAVVKIDAKGLPTVKLGNSDKIQPGQTVIAIGNALGIFNNTVSKGIISGLSRKISASLGADGQVENLRHVMQTDVAINQGNSGGPLVNLNGEVVGINTAIIYGAQNIGFAIPVNWAKADVADLREFGRIVRPYIGLRYLNLDREIQEKHELPVDYGALVIKDHMPGSEAVVKGSPAAKAGIKENDIILAINGEKLSDKHEIADSVEEHEVGDTLTLEILRNKKKKKVKLILEERK